MTGHIMPDSCSLDKPRAELPTSVEDLTSESVSEVVEQETLSDADVRHNMKVNILVDSLMNCGWSDMFLIIVPLLVFLHSSNSLIGAVTAASFMTVFGISVTPFITRRFRYKRWYFAVSYCPFLMCMVMLALGLVSYRQFHLSNPAPLTYSVLLIVAAWFFYGFTYVPAMEFMAACIPAELRGRLIGYSLTVGGLLAIGGSLAAKWILQHVDSPMSFGYVILLGYAVYQISVIAILFARELPTPVEKSPRAWSKDMLKAFLHDGPYLRFTILGCLETIFFGAVGTFVFAYGFKVLKMPVALAAVLGIIDQVIRLATSGIAGHFVDKLKPQRVLPYLYMVYGISMLPILILHNAYALYLFVVVRTLGGVALCPANRSLAQGIPSEENRAGHYTIASLTGYATGALGPLALGISCDQLGYRAVFLAVACLSLGMYVLSKQMLKGVALRK